MAYNYLGLVNEVNRRLNEVELTSSNFASASGFYAQVKDSVNASIQEIDQEYPEWPYNFVEQEDVLTAGVTRYSFPANSTTIDFESFRIKEDSTLSNRTQKLQVLTYEEYLDRFVEQEYTSDTSLRSVPVYVAKGHGLEYILSPAPNKAYTAVYEYYLTSTDLIDSTDVPKIPEIYRNVIIDGSMYYAYMFRGNTQDAMVAEKKFKDGLKNMRMVLINKNTYVRSTMLTRTQRSTYVYRLAS
jgi:hypothetical protein|tara:strand:+ start:904 stop:1629 length:726 start_codon:yes stop_codon:yes gene_type:complete